MLDSLLFELLAAGPHLGGRLPSSLALTAPESSYCSALHDSTPKYSPHIMPAIIHVVLLKFNDKLPTDFIDGTLRPEGLKMVGKIPGLKRVELGKPMELTKARSQGWQASAYPLLPPPPDLHTASSSAPPIVRLTVRFLLRPRLALQPLF